jgi:hypothetical protein
MTSIAAKLEQRIEFLIGRENGIAPKKVSYIRHYLTYLVVRNIFRAICSTCGKLLTRETSLTGYESLKICLYIFIAFSLYFPMHALCCFEELKVTTGLT